MSKHTPGPWGVTASGLNVKNGNLDRMIFESAGECSFDEAIANARLIAAAPDMLEALKTLENDNNQIPSFAWDIIQKAIAKAEADQC